VLTQTGGSFQGVGRDEWYLLVSNAQYQALVEAKVVAGSNGAEEQPRGKKPAAKAKL
jgi:hypothetical protein